MAIIRITNLKIRTIIGIYDWERTQKQDVIINIAIDFNGEKASRTDALEDTLDYKTLTKEIIREVEASNFYLLEKLVRLVLDLVMKNFLVQKATVRVDKPLALRFADSVSLEMTEERQ